MTWGDLKLKYNDRFIIKSDDISIIKLGPKGNGNLSYLYDSIDNVILYKYDVRVLNMTYIELINLFELKITKHLRNSKLESILL